MKKLLLLSVLIFGLSLAIFIVLLAISSNLFSQNPDSTKYYGEVVGMIDDGLKENVGQIKAISWNLTAEQKQSIYDARSKSALPVLLNILPGFGIGSWIMGDGTGGTIGTSGEFIGALFMLVGGTANNHSNNSLTVGKSDYIENNPSVAEIGAIIYFAAKILDLIISSSYSYHYNARLKEALRLPLISKINISPNLNLAGLNHFAPGFQL